MKSLGFNTVLILLTSSEMASTNNQYKIFFYTFQLLIWWSLKIAPYRCIFPLNSTIVEAPRSLYWKREMEYHPPLFLCFLMKLPFPLPSWTNRTNLTNASSIFSLMLCTVSIYKHPYFNYKMDQHNFPFNSFP